MKLETFMQALKGQHTVRLEFPRNAIEVAVSDLIVGENGLIEYTTYDSDVWRRVLTRVSEVVEVKSVCSIEDWNASCDHWDTLHDLHGLQGF